jgi:hypothetical protein
MSKLRNTIADLAARFAADLVEAMRTMSLDELIAEVGGKRALGAGRGGAAPVLRGRRGKGGRLARRSAADLAKAVEAIVGLLDKHPQGMRAEQIRSSLGLDAKELPKPLADALAAKRISKKGEKRATTYFSSKRGK